MADFWGTKKTLSMSLRKKKTTMIIGKKKSLKL